MQLLLFVIRSLEVKPLQTPSAAALMPLFGQLHCLVWCLNTHVPARSRTAIESCSAEILAFMPATEAAAKAQSAADQPQLLAQPQVEAANQQPGLKVQRLVSALWNLDRVDQRALPLDGSFSYGTASTAGTGVFGLGRSQGFGWL
jgi:hypothetical protein